jgi:CheY-like chemotaxis protein
VHVSSPTAAARRSHEALLRLVEIGEKLARFGVEDLCADRDSDDQRLAALAVLVFAAAVFAVLSAQKPLVFEVEQRRQAEVSFEDYIASIASIAAGGPAQRFVLLAAHRDRTVATATALDLERDFIYEAHGGCLLGQRGTCKSSDLRSRHGVQSQTMTQAANSALFSARLRFVEGLPARAEELSSTAERLARDPSDPEAAAMLRRRLHALLASAQVFEERALSLAVQDLIARLDIAQRAERPFTSEEIDAVGLVVASLPTYVKPSLQPTAAYSDVRELRAGERQAEPAPRESAADGGKAGDTWRPPARERARASKSAEIAVPASLRAQPTVEPEETLPVALAEVPAPTPIDRATERRGVGEARAFELAEGRLDARPLPPRARRIVALAPLQPARDLDAVDEPSPELVAFADALTEPDERDPGTTAEMLLQIARDPVVPGVGYEWSQAVAAAGEAMAAWRESLRPSPPDIEIVGALDAGAESVMPAWLELNRLETESSSIVGDTFGIQRSIERNSLAAAEAATEPRPFEAEPTVSSSRLTFDANADQERIIVELSPEPGSSETAGRITTVAIEPIAEDEDDDEDRVTTIDVPPIEVEPVAAEPVAELEDRITIIPGEPVAAEPVAEFEDRITVIPGEAVEPIVEREMRPEIAEWADTPTELHERSQTLSKAEEDFEGLLEPAADAASARTRRESASDLALALREARAARESATEVDVDFGERSERESATEVDVDLSERAERESATEPPAPAAVRTVQTGAASVSDTVRPGPSWGVADFLRRGVAKSEHATVAGDWGMPSSVDADADADADADPDADSSATTGVTSQPQLGAATTLVSDDADADSSATALLPSGSAAQDAHLDLAIIAASGESHGGIVDQDFSDRTETGLGPPVLLEQTVSGLRPAQKQSRVLLVAEASGSARLRSNPTLEHFEIVHATNADEAVRRLHDSKPDIVLVSADLATSPEADLVRRVKHDPLASVESVHVLMPESATYDDSFLEQIGADSAVREPLTDAALEPLLQLTVPPPPTERTAPREGSIDEIAAQIAEEIRRGIAESLRTGTQEQVQQGSGSQLMAAAWSAIGRVRSHLADQNGRREADSSSSSSLLPAVDPSADGSRTPSIHPSQLLAGHRVLVADDDPAVLWFFVGLLREASAQVLQAHNGREALELARRKQPHVIVSDILMPKLDGFGLCRELKRDALLSHVPVILLSWKDDLLQRMRELDAGAAGYLRKEAGSQQILTQLTEALAPRTRFVSKLRSQPEVSGVLAGLGALSLLELVAAERPDARIAVRDAYNLFEVEIRGGRRLSVTRTAADGTFTRGEKALMQLLGLAGGEFQVSSSSAPLKGQIPEPLDRALAAAGRRLSALLDAVSDARLLRVSLVAFDDEVLQSLLSEPGSRLREVVALFRTGHATAEGVLREGRYSPGELEEDLRELARAVAITGVWGANGEDLVAAAQRERETPQLALLSSTLPPRSRSGTWSLAPESKEKAATSRSSSSMPSVGSISPEKSTLAAQPAPTAADDSTKTADVEVTGESTTTSDTSITGSTSSVDVIATADSTSSTDSTPPGESIATAAPDDSSIETSSTSADGATSEMDTEVATTAASGDSDAAVGTDTAQARTSAAPRARRSTLPPSIIASSSVAFSSVDSDAPPPSAADGLGQTDAGLGPTSEPQAVPDWLNPAIASKPATIAPPSSEFAVLAARTPVGTPSVPTTVQAREESETDAVSKAELESFDLPVPSAFARALPQRTDTLRLAGTLIVLSAVGYIGWQQFMLGSAAEKATAPQTRIEAAKAPNVVTPAPQPQPARAPASTSAAPASAPAAASQATAQPAQPTIQNTQFGKVLPFVDSSRGVAVAPDEGLLVIELQGSDPAPNVRVGTRELGKPPIAVALPAGRHELVVRSGKSTSFRYLVVRPGETRIVTVPLAEL